MNDEPNDRSPWARPNSDGESVPVSVSSPRGVTGDSAASTQQPTRPSRQSRSWFGPILAVTVAVTAGFGFAVGRTTESADAEPAGAAATTTAPGVAIGGVTPPTPAPSGDGQSDDESNDTDVLDVLEIDSRLVGPTKLVGTTRQGLIEIDLATGEMRSLAATKPGSATPLVVAGDDWVVATDGERLISQQDSIPELAVLSRLPGTQAAWSATSSLGWVAEARGGAGQMTSWRQVTLEGETVTTIEVPDAAWVAGATNQGIIGAYRGSTYLFNGDGASWIADGQPLATNSLSTVILTCARSTQCDLVVTNAQTGDKTTTPIEDPSALTAHLFPSAAFLSPDSTKLLLPTPDSDDDLRTAPSKLLLVDLNSGEGRSVETLGRIELQSPVGWTTDSRYAIVITGRKLVALDTTTGDEFALAQPTDVFDSIVWTGLAVRP